MAEAKGGQAEGGPRQAKRKSWVIEVDKPSGSEKAQSIVQAYIEGTEGVVETHRKLVQVKLLTRRRRAQRLATRRTVRSDPCSA